jgi:DNA-binding response OmpR family regulator
VQHILIVESDAQIRRLLERWLVEAGHAVVSPSGGAHGSMDSLDLVIADVGSSTKDLPRRVAELHSAHHAPLLLISPRFRRGLAASREAAHRLGVQAVLPTPFDRSELMAALDSAVA